MLAHPSRPVDPNHAVYDGEQLEGKTRVVNSSRTLLSAPEESFADSCTPSSLSSVVLPEGLTEIGDLAAALDDRLVPATLSYAM